MCGYPIILDLSGRRVAVVGLGAVGRRKALGLIEAGAKVVAIDPVGFPGPPPPGLTILAEPYRTEHLEGALLAFASATPEVNRLVVADARRLGILVNAASDPTSGDFSLPAVHRDGPLLLAVSTGGAGPALAGSLRDRAAVALGPSASGMALLLAELRPLARSRIPNATTRRRLFRRWADPSWLDRWAADGPEAVRSLLIDSIDHAAFGGDDPS
ncbi:precorrin-2 dehydrogenase/sirohydrochlorin ferrochelatase family protein [Tautonia sociabilis]|uniref:precorrin-2 dehydrogenase n=1 Tax=Tautonia sociabilis TaxID=2080755 RepID=A0A432MQZ5_9BACT|nr:bifunctional precorrin-2 dehydrogenase/sirohydrochlorin ferrochelatase [Tautonia sociabilis]RUL89378.1 bifunctional precorrin-2 dehydrogenase/sirohydrochlorin ferrochelatase [Tautonia sociabilis]